MKASSLLFGKSAHTPDQFLELAGRIGSNASTPPCTLCQPCCGGPETGGSSRRDDAGLDGGVDRFAAAGAAPRWASIAQPWHRRPYAGRP